MTRPEPTHRQTTRRSLTCSVLLAALLLALAAADLHAQPAMDVRKLFTLPEGAITPNNSYSPVRHEQGKTYAVWMDANWRPMVTEIDDATGKVANVPLDPKSDYTARKDGHHYFSMGMDKNGYLHITGDMHNYSQTTQHELDRYSRHFIMYWKSNKPYSITDGFTFVGGDADKALPGQSWTYGCFYSDNNGELYYLSRVVANTGGHKPGQMGIGLYRYDAQMQRWSAVGGEGDHVRGEQTTYLPVLFWENGGVGGPGGWYQGFMAALFFDQQNRMHFAASANSTPEYYGSNVLVYACSEDDGKTWKKADGSPIARLPLRSAPGPNQADVVRNITEKGLLGYYYNNPNLEGEPVLVRPDDQVKFNWNGQAPSRELKPDSFSVRWEGYVQVPEGGGEYTYRATATGGQVRLSVMEEEKFPPWVTLKASGDWTSVASSTTTFKAVEQKRLTVEFRRDNSGALATVQLGWSSSSIPEQIVPRGFLRLRTGYELGSFVGVGADRNGTPAVLYWTQGDSKAKLTYWDRKAHNWPSDLPGYDAWDRRKLYMDSTGAVVFEGSGSGIFQLSDFTAKPVQYNPKIGELLCCDAYSLRTRGVYWGIARIKGKPASIVRITYGRGQ